MSEELNILDYLKVVRKWKNFIVSATAALVVLTVLACLAVPWRYKAETTIIIPQQMGQELAGLLGVTSMLNGSSVNMPTDISQSLLGRTTNFSDILKSSTVSGMIVDALGLTKTWHINKGAAVRRVKRELRVREMKDILRISVVDRDPELAADMANFAVLALDQFNSTGNVQYARSLNDFVRDQLAAAKVDLSDAEENLKVFENQSEMVRISEKELKLVSLTRDVKVKEAIYTMLLQEYEKTKIDEARKDLFFEVLDPAAVPRSPYAPRPFAYAMIALVLGGVGFTMLAFFFEYLEKSGFKVPEMDYNMEVEWERIKRYLTAPKR